MPMLSKIPHDAYKRFKTVKAAHCPCCGSEDIYKGHWTAMSMGIHCNKCGLTMAKQFPNEWNAGTDIELITLKKAAKAWNKRVK
jgi:uncharacterized protein (DUF983 family)